MRPHALVPHAARLAAALAVALLPWQAQACAFRVKTGWQLAFGTMVAGSPGPYTATVSVNAINGTGVGNCAFGTPMKVTVRSIQNQAACGQPCLRHSTANEFIPYRVGFGPGLAAETTITSLGGGLYLPLSPTLTAVVAGSDLRNALPGSYTDTLLLEVTP